MSKIQPVKFHSLEDFFSYLPEQELAIVKRLRGLVFACLPEAKEKLSYNVPFYSGHRRICFIWPSAVPWGKVPPSGVQFGFCEGYRMRDEIGWLEQGNRKMVYTKTFFHVREIDEDLLKAYLFEAIVVDEQPRHNPNLD